MVTHQSLNKIRLFYAAYFAAMGLILPFFPLYLDDRGFDAAMIGLMTGLIALAKVIAPPWIGHVLDGRSAATTHRFIVIASALAALTAFLFGLSEHIILFAIIVLLFGVFWATILPLTDGLSITVSESDGADYGRLRVWGSIGFVITSLAGGLWLVGDYIQAFPIVLGVLMLILVFASIGFPMFKPAAMETLESTAFSKTFYTLLAISFIMQVSHGAYYGFFSLYLAEAGYSGGQIGLYWVIGVVAEIILMWRWSKALQAAAPALVFTICLLLASLRWLGIALTTDPVLLILLQLLHAASFAAFHVAAIAWVKRLAPDSRHAAAQGLFSAAGFGLGSTIGIMGCGLIASAFGFTTAFYLCALVALLGIPLCLLLRNINHTIKMKG
ncbi:MAG: MFS transporter [Mariprofundus sp.]|nr:MFS transporter [Mariprofundus sp.]